MRALVLSWEYPPLLYGGLGRHVHELAEALARAGHAVTVVTQAAPAAPGDEVVDGVRIVRAPAAPPDLAMAEDLLAWVLALGHRLTRAALQVAEEAAAAGAPYEVVHAHDWVVAHPAVALAEQLRAPLVVTVHATEAGRHQGWLPTPLSRSVHAIEWWLTGQARRVITCSRSMRTEVCQLFDLPGDQVDVVPNGVDPRGWLLPAGETPAPDPGLVVFVGRLEHEKGVQTLLDAVPALRRQHPDLRVVIVGTGSHERALREQAQRLRLASTVTFTGRVEQAVAASLLHSCAAAVVPSTYEPFGIVALEAAAAGAPLAVAASGGLRETVEPGVSGEVFTPGDPAALAEAVSALLRDPSRARRLAAVARERALREHDWDALAARTAQVWAHAASEEPVEARPPSPPPDREGNLLAPSCA